MSKLKIVNIIAPPLVILSLTGSIAYMRINDIAVPGWVSGLLIAVAIYWWGELTGVRAKATAKITKLIKS